MNREQFLAALADPVLRRALAPGDLDSIDADGLRLRPRQPLRLRICGPACEGVETHGETIEVSDADFCPITAVCAIKTGEFFLTSDYQEAGDRLGLPYWEIENIVRAADVADRVSAELRGQLLEAVGINTGLR